MGRALAMPDLGSVVDGARSGEVLAQRELIDYLARELLGFALALCRNAHEADEVLADTLSRVYERLPQLKDPDALLPWARQILVRRFVDGRRWWRARTVQLDVVVTVEHEPVDLDHLDLRIAVGGLARADQALLALHYWAGLTLAECAAILRIPEGTAKSRLWSIRNELRKTLGGRHG